MSYSENELFGGGGFGQDSSLALRHDDKLHKKFDKRVIEWGRCIRGKLYNVFVEERCISVKLAFLIIINCTNSELKLWVVSLRQKK